MERPPHILNAASNLLGICFVIITGLRITRLGGHTAGDEFAWVAAFCFLASTLLSFIQIRSAALIRQFGLVTDMAFFAGIAMLTMSAIATSWELK